MSRWAWLDQVFGSVWQKSCIIYTREYPQATKVTILSTRIPEDFKPQFVPASHRESLTDTSRHWSEINNNNSVRCVDFECLNEPPIIWRWWLMTDIEVTAVGHQSRSESTSCQTCWACEKDGTSHVCSDHSFHTTAATPMEADTHRKDLKNDEAAKQIYAFWDF